MSFTRIVSTSLFSLPTSSTVLNIVILIINSVLLAGVYDFKTISIRDPATSVVFTRIGAVGPNEAKIVVRYPGIEDGLVRILWRESHSVATWNSGPIIALVAERDWVGTTRLTGLWPSTNYEYRLAYENSTFLPYPENPISIRTFPDPDLHSGTRFKFMASSCIMPNFPYLPFQHQRIKGFDLLGQYITSKQDEGLLTEEQRSATVSSPILHGTVNLSSSPFEFMLLLGDFIYADVPHYAGSDLESYRRLYRRVYSSPSFRKVYEHLPIFHIFDDHEILNDFAGKSDVAIWPLPNASSAYFSYNGEANHDPVIKNGNFYTFRYGDVAFFVLDTRSYRTPFNGDNDMTMLGNHQITALRDWLQQVNTTVTFKFIVSSVPFTSLWSFNAQDTWAGFIEERNDILSVLSTIPNAYVISGDRHEFAAIEYMGGKVVEFSTSPLSAAYVPIIRSLKRQSEDSILIQKDDSEESSISNRFVPQEKVIKYLPLGSYKWSTFEIDTTDHQAPKLTMETVIDGKPEWRYSIIGQPVNIKSSKAVTSQLTKSLKGALQKIGLSPDNWF